MALKKLPTNISSLLDSSVHVNSYRQIVEELVYNALDSDASSVAVRINIQENQIQVVDNGCGVTQTDMKYIGKRNFTSKCYNSSNLKSLPTKYGFRGRALSNILSISKIVKFTSRYKNSTDTWQNEYINGKLNSTLNVNTRPSQGTTVEVFDCFYNRQLRNKLCNSIEEMQDIKYFLECIALVHHNISISLRDDVKNEIMLSIHKKRDIYQTIDSVFGIPKSNLQELHVEKNSYKVIAFIEKRNLCQSKSHLVYLNGRFLHKSKIHQIIDYNLMKALDVRIANTKQCKNINLYDDVQIGMKKLPFYIIFFNCPYSEFDLNQFSKRSVIEFNDWNKTNNILEKLVKFYVGDIKLKEILPLQKVGNELKVSDTRDQVKKMMDRIFDKHKNTCKIPKLHNGVTGKVIKRKKKKVNGCLLKTTNIESNMFQTTNINKTEKYINQTCAKSKNKFEGFVSDLKKKPNCTSKKTIKPCIKRTKNQNHEKEMAKDPTESVKNKLNTVAKSINNGFTPIFKKPCIKTKTVRSGKLKQFEDPTESIKRNLNISNKPVSNKVSYKIKNKCDRTKGNENSLREMFKRPTKQMATKSKTLIKNVNRSLKPKQKIGNTKKCAYNTLLNNKTSLKNNDHKRLMCKHVHRPINYSKTTKNKNYIVSSYDLLKTIIHPQSEICLNYHKIKSYSRSNKIMCKKINTNCDVLCSFQTYESHNGYYLDNANYAKEVKINSHNHPKKINSSNRTLKKERVLSNHKVIPTSNNCMDASLIKHTDNIKKDRSTLNTNKIKKIISSSHKKNGHTMKDLKSNRQNSNDIYFYKAKMIKTDVEKIYENIKGMEIFTKSFTSYETTKDICYLKSAVTGNTSGQNSLLNFSKNFTFKIDNRLEKIQHDLSDVKCFNMEFHGRTNKITSENSKNNISQTNNYLKSSNISESSQNINVVFISKHFTSQQILCSNFTEIFDPLNLCETVMETHDEVENNKLNISNTYPAQNIKESIVNVTPNLCKNDRSNFRKKYLEYFRKEKTTKRESHKVGKTIEDPPESNQDAVHFNLQIKNNMHNPLTQVLSIEVVTNSKETNKSNLIPEKMEVHDINKCIKSLVPMDQDIFDVVVPPEDGNHFTKSAKDSENIFNFKTRLHFVPKGISPIFHDYACNFVEHSLDVRCFNNSMYENFFNNINKDSKIYEEIVLDANPYMIDDVDGLHKKCIKDKAAIVFETSSLKSAKVLKQIDRKFIAAKIIGRNVIFKTCNEHLVLFDQHAIHERIKLEEKLSDYLQNNSWVTEKIDKILLNLSKEEILYLHNYKDKFSRYGLEWRFINDNDILIETVPRAIIGKNNRELETIAKTIKFLIAELVTEIKLQKGSLTIYPKSIMELVCSEACKCAIKFGDPLQRTECKKLIESLSFCKIPFQCAHGRPVMAVLLDLKTYNSFYKIDFNKVKDFGKSR